MTSIVLTCSCLLLVFGMVAGTAQSGAGMPLPAPSPPPTPSGEAIREVVSTPAVPLVLHAGQDSVVFDSPRAEPQEVHTATLLPGRTQTFVLPDRSIRHIDVDSPASRFVIRLGDTIIVSHPDIQPRYITVRRQHSATFQFRALSRRGIALVVEHVPDSSHLTAAVSRPASILATARRAQSPLAVDRSDSTQVVILPASWYPVGKVRVPSEWSSMRVTFFAYGDPVLTGDRGPLRGAAAAKHELGARPRGEILSEAALLNPTPETLLTATALGSVLLPGKQAVEHSIRVLSPAGE